MPRGTPKSSICVRIDQDTLLKTRELLTDPLTKKTRHGSISDLIDNLLLQWCAAQLKLRELKPKGKASD